MQSKNPNRFFGLNPVGIPNNGRKDVVWNHDLPTSWREAVAEAPTANAAAHAAVIEAEEFEGDADDA